MPIVTLTVVRPKSLEFKKRLLSAVHAALCAVGVHLNDRFHRVLELDAGDFDFDRTFPDVRTRRTEDFALVEILLGAGRSTKVKKEILAHLERGLRSDGFDTENLMVVFLDVPWENWSPAGGRMPHG